MREASDNIDLSGKQILDYGCGSMPYRYLFVRSDNRYTGADIAENKSAELVIDTENGKVGIADGYADVVISTQVLEHVISPKAYLDEAFRITKPGGTLLLSTHGFWLYHPNPTDFWRWTAAGLKKQLNDSGWEVEQIDGVFGFAAAALALYQDAIAIKLPSWLRTPFCFMMQQFVALTDWFYSKEGRRENAALYLIKARRKSKV